MKAAIFLFLFERSDDYKHPDKDHDEVAIERVGIIKSEVVGEDTALDFPIHPIGVNAHEEHDDDGQNGWGDDIIDGIGNRIDEKKDEERKRNENDGEK